MDKSQSAYPKKADAKAFSVREKILSFQRAITPKELAEIMKISVATISQQAHNGMPCIRFGGSVRFDPRDLLAWMDSQSISSADLKR